MVLPCFEMVINPDETSDVEVSFVALVPKPAIERNFLAFNSHQLHFKTDDDKRIISGPAMVADTLIYRRDDQGEYNVFFSKDTIKKIALKFFQKNYQKNLNLFHDPTLSIEGVTIFESFISDESRGISGMKGYEDLPDGTWFISAKVENDAVWSKVKSGEVKGFSVEGIFSYVKKERPIEEKLYEILSATLPKNCHLPETELMASAKEMFNEFKKKFFDTNVPLTPPKPTQAPPAQTPPPNKQAGDYTLKDGTAVMISELVVGGTVMVGDVPAPAGEHELSDGTKVTIGEGGVIMAIQTSTTPGTATPPAPNFDAQFQEINQKFTAYEQKFAEQAKTIQDLAASFNKTNETIVGLVGIVEKLSQLPTADSVSESKKTFSSERAASKEEKRADLAVRLKTLRESKN